jgi:hypothetical protein
MKTPPVNVQPVTTVVMNVMITMNVMFALLTDHKMVSQNAHAQLVLTTTVMPNVQIVHINV